MPSDEEISIFDKILILQAEHSSSASTFAARVAIGAQSHPISAITSALTTFSGDLHGGAIESVFDTVCNLPNSKRKIKLFIDQRLAQNKPIPGFGHRIYKSEDPRAKPLKEAAQKLSTIHDNTALLEKTLLLVELMEKYRKLGLCINVDLYAAICYSLLGIHKTFFTSTFFMSRLSGICAHILEQHENNILIRPLLEYVGETDKRYISMEKRS